MTRNYIFFNVNKFYERLARLSCVIASARITYQTDEYQNILAHPNLLKLQWNSTPFAPLTVAFLLMTPRHFAKKWERPGPRATLKYLCTKNTAKKMRPVHSGTAIYPVTDSQLWGQSLRLHFVDVFKSISLMLRHMRLELTY